MLGFGRDRHKQRIKFGIVQVLQRASQVLRQEIPQVRSSIVTRYGFPGEATGFAGATENKSGVVSAERRGGIFELCRRDRIAETPGRLLNDIIRLV